MKCKLIFEKYSTDYTRTTLDASLQEDILFSVMHPGCTINIEFDCLPFEDATIPIDEIEDLEEMLERGLSCRVYLVKE